jgi:hypothetical protein
MAAVQQIRSAGAMAVQFDPLTATPERDAVERLRAGAYDAVVAVGCRVVGAQVLAAALGLPVVDVGAGVATDVVDQVRRAVDARAVPA